MSLDALLTAITVVSVLALLAAMTFLVVSGVLDAAEAVTGFSNTGVLTVAVLYVVVAGLRETGAISWIAQRLLGRPRGSRSALVRLMLPTVAFSAFLNNTPIVAIMVGASASFITPIGYQTNLMVYGPGGYRFSDYVRVGLPLSVLVAAAAIVLIVHFFPFA